MLDARGYCVEIEGGGVRGHLLPEQEHVAQSHKHCTKAKRSLLSGVHYGVAPLHGTHRPTSARKLVRTDLSLGSLWTRGRSGSTTWLASTRGHSISLSRRYKSASKPRASVTKFIPMSGALLPYQPAEAAASPSPSRMTQPTSQWSISSPTRAMP